MRPPRVSEWLLLRSHPPEERDAVAGDLAEEFAELTATRGGRAARRWYRRQMRHSLIPNVVRRVRRDTAGGNRIPSSGLAGGFAMRSLLPDIRFTVRLAARRPLVTLVALVSLVIGVSLATVVFTLLDAVALRPLPIEDPGRLALVVERRPTGTNYNFSHPDFVDYRRAQQAFTDLAAWSAIEVTLRHGADPRPIVGELVSGAFFDVVGIPMRMGRPLSEADDVPGAKAVAVVSESLWNRLGGGERFEPRTLRLNETSFDIVGIVEPSFGGMEVGRRALFWVPTAHQGAMEPRPGGDDLLGERRSSWLFMVGRLRDGVSLEAAEADLARVEASLAGVQHHRTMTLAVEPGAHGRSSLPERAGSTLRLLFTASILVLVIAAANLANLLLAGIADRSREFAIRGALGAGRAALARLVILESVLLGAVAGILSAVVAHWMANLTVPLIQFYGEPVWLDVSLDARTLGFAAAAGLCAAVAGGVAPAVAMLRSGAPAGPLAAGARASGGPRGRRFRAALLVVQFALSLALVTVAALFVRTVGNLLATPTGYDADHVALLSVDPTTVDAEPEAIRQYLETAEARLRAVPGVRAAGFARVTPVGFGGSRMSVTVPGYEPQPDEDMELNYNTVTEGYFEATGISLLSGRALSAADRAGRPLAAVVNQTMAERFWGGPAAVGETFRIGDEVVEVVGVAPDVKYRMVREAPRPSFYMSVRQLLPRAGVFHVRTYGEPAALLPSLRQALIEVDPRIAVTDARTLRQQVRGNVNDERLAMIVGMVLAGTALLLAGAGLFASMWYAVGRRTREIGVRMALGADASGLTRMVLREALVLVLAGGVLGAGLAFWLGRLVENRLYGVAASDPVSFAAAAGVLGAAALSASWAPARRASLVDPVVALRTD